MGVELNLIGQQMSMDGQKKAVAKDAELNRLQEKKIARVKDEHSESPLSELRHNRSFYYNVDQELNRVIIKIVDLETDKVIEEIPSEDMQKFLRYFNRQVGLLIDEKV